MQSSDKIESRLYRIINSYSTSVLFGSVEARWNFSQPKTIFDFHFNTGQDFDSSFPARILLQKPLITFISSIHDSACNCSLPLECPLLSSSIPNGFVNGRGSVEGSLYQFSCRQGYSLVGANTLYCNDQGNWNGSIPTCLIGRAFISMLIRMTE